MSSTARRQALSGIAIAAIALSSACDGPDPSPSRDGSGSGGTTITTSTGPTTTSTAPTTTSTGPTTTTTGSTTSSGTTTTRSLTTTSAELAPGQTECPWDKARVCQVIGPTLLEPVKKMARIQAPTPKELQRATGISKRYSAKEIVAPKPNAATPSRPKPNAAPGDPLAPEPRGPGNGALSGAGAPEPILPSPGAPRATVTVPRIPGLPAGIGGVDVAPNVFPKKKCKPNELFMCHPDVTKSAYMASFTVSTVDIDVITFMKEYDECAAKSGQRPFLDQLLGATADLLQNKGFKKESPLVSQAQHKAEVQAWRGTSPSDRELEIFVSQTAQEDGISHMLYYPTSKQDHAAELQTLIDDIRRASDFFFMGLLTKGSCPPAD